MELMLAMATTIPLDEPQAAIALSTTLNACLPPAQSVRTLNRKLMTRMDASITDDTLPRLQRNACLIWAILAQRLAGRICELMFDDGELRGRVRGILVGSKYYPGVRLAAMCAVQAFLETRR